MGFIKTELEGVLVFEPKVFPDDRGYFFESYNKNVFTEAGLKYDFVQDNQSRSTYGVLRGLHYQLEPHAQTKLVRVVEGRILDLVVDLRKSSKTYGKWISVELSDQNHRQSLIPKGFAHGFVVLSDIAVVSYKCDSFYNKDAEAGIRFDDPDLNIDWKIPHKDIKVSEKDLNNPLLKDAKNNF